MGQLDPMQNCGGDRTVPARHAAYAEDLRILLQRYFDQLGRGLLETRDDDLHPGLAAGVREELDRVDMPVQSGLAERDSNWPLSLGQAEELHRPAAIQHRWY